MIKNIHKLDRVIRILIFVILLTLYLTNTLTGTLGISLLVIGTILLLTSILNFCPIYRLLGISTCKIK